MKKVINSSLVFMLIISLIGLPGCESQQSGSMTNNTNQGFTVEGMVENGDEVLVLLDARDSGDWINLDSSIIENGRFSLSGSVDHPQMVYLKFVEDGETEYIEVFIENSAITINGDADDVDRLTVSGSASHDVHSIFSDQYNKFYESYDSLYTLMESVEDEEVKDSLAALIEMVEADSEVFLKQFIAENAASQVAPYLALRHLTYDSEYDELEPIVADMTDKVGTSKYLDALNESLAKLKELAIGKVAPEFTQAGVDGEEVSLSSLRGNYVLVDFWASWCKPCRQENPNVVAMYHEFSGRDFEIIGVSLDKTKEKWLKAIEDDQLVWEHVSDLQGWKNEVAGIYNVKAIPSTYLLDKEGKIVAKNIRGDELKDKIRELLDDAS